MKRIIPFALVLWLAGCFPLPAPNTPDKPNKPDAPQVTRADVCEQLAGYITAGRIKSTDDLLRVLRIMKDAGHWTDVDSAAVDAAIPDLASSKRPLTADDAAKLSGIK